MSCDDHLGFERLSEVLAQSDGSIVPLATMLDLSSSHKNLALKSSIAYLLSPENIHRLAFPVVSGTLQWNQGWLSKVKMDGKMAQFTWKMSPLYWNMLV